MSVECNVSTRICECGLLTSCKTLQCCFVLLTPKCFSVVAVVAVVAVGQGWSGNRDIKGPTIDLVKQPVLFVVRM